jgi:Sulfotransferase domain
LNTSPGDKRRGSRDTHEERPVTPPDAASPRPNFLVIGAMKSGTTSLYNYLRAHPEVYLPDLKEVDFFTAEMNWDKGWKWYGKQFAPAPASAKAVGEASTSYTKYPRFAGVPERIAEHLPDAKLIYVLRDPIDRMRSHYQHNVALGEERASIDDALLHNPTYIDCSRYAMQLERYLEHFPRERILVFSSEELRHDRAATVRRVLEFLDVAPDADIGNLDEEFYKTSERASMPAPVAAVRRGLKRAFPKSVGLWRGRFVPEGIKRRLGKKVGEKDVASAISPETRARLEEELSKDVRRLKELVPELDGWGFA